MDSRTKKPPCINPTVLPDLYCMTFLDIPQWRDSSNTWLTRMILKRLKSYPTYLHSICNNCWSIVVIWWSLNAPTIQVGGIQFMSFNHFLDWTIFRYYSLQAGESSLVKARSKAGSFRWLQNPFEIRTLVLERQQNRYEYYHPDTYW